MARQQNILTNLPKQFKQMLKEVTVRVLNAHGVKANSALAKSVEFSDDNRSDAIFMYVNDYYQHVSNGRRPGARKVPIYALVQWIKRSGIQLKPGQSVNDLAFVIQRSIYLNGIKGKNFMSVVRDTVTDTVQIEVGDMIEQLVADSLYAAFQVK